MSSEKRFLIHSAATRIPLPAPAILRARVRALAGLFVLGGARFAICGDIPANEFFSPDSFTAGIQEAVDRLPPEGGIVQLPAGRFLLRRSVNLPSNVTLRGSGSATVLTRPDQARSPLARRAEAGETAIEVEDGSRFEVGAQIAIFPEADRGRGGWAAAKKIVTAVDGNTLTLDRPLRYAYDPETRGVQDRGMGGWPPVAINLFPGISVSRANDVRIEDLKLDGNPARNPGPETTFTLAAIHVERASQDCLIRNVTVSGWPSDGIGVQGGSGHRITGCIVEDCRGDGFHPGTGIRNSFFSGNIARRNKQDGLYFCALVRQVLVSDSLFEDNRRHGIGGLGDSGDRYNVVANNICSGNGLSGIHAVNGAHNTITGNMALNNSRSQPGAHPGIRLHRVTDMLVIGNRCLDDQSPRTQSFGIEESGEQSNRNLIIGNHCMGNLKGGILLQGTDSVATRNAPADVNRDTGCSCRAEEG
ncbi:MAG: right-handed parallel beta-helix repeat-containing protein, partial [Kiritimatiellia bacterium]|nr:right-handed parallel beta-helix repeat-containing protein [Kiritimatiellia bacterium]